MTHELGYKITVDAEEGTRTQREVVKNFDDIDTAARQASAGLKTVETSARTTASGLGSVDQQAAKARGQLLAYARAGVQAKNDIEKLGGAQKLTSAEIDRYIGVVTRAAKANEALGRSNRGVEADQARLLAHLRASRQSTEAVAASQTKMTAAGAAQSAMLSRLTGAFAGYLSAGAILGAIKSTAAYADTLQTTAARTGLTVEAVQRLGFAARQNGTNLDRLTSSLNLMQDRLASGNEQAAAALGLLGLSASQLAQMKPDQQLFAISDGLQRVGSHNEKIAILNDLFGRGGSELLPLFNSELRKTADEADRVGQVIDAKTVAALARMDDAIENVTIAGRGMIANFLAPVLPYLEGATQQALAFAGAWNQLLSGQANVGNIGQFFSSAAQAGHGMGLLGMMTPQGIAAMISASSATAGGFGDIDLGQNDALRFEMTEVVTGKLGEQNRLGKDREESLKRQTAELQRQQKALEQMIRAEAAALTARVHGADWWGRSGMTGADVGGSAWDAFMKGGPVPMSYYSGQDRAFQAMLRGSGFESQNILSPSAIAEIGQQISLDVANRYNDPGDVGETLADRMAKDFSAIFPQAIMQAVTGGGSVSGGIGSAVGKSVGTALAKGLPETFASGFLGQMLGGLIPGLGALVGPALDALLNKPSMQANDLRDEFFAQNGGFDQVNRRAAEAGFDIHRVLQASNPERLQQAIQDLTSAIEEAERARRDDIQSLLSDRGLVDPALISSIYGRRDFVGGDAERGALEQFYTGNLSRAAGGYQGFLQAGGQVSAANASGFGAGVAGIFGEMVGSGTASPTQALQQLQPIIEGLSSQFQQLGLDGGAAFADIASLAHFAADEAVAPAIAQVVALDDVLVGLGNTALLDQNMFKAFEDQIGDTYQSLIDQGKNGDQALRLMQPTLQTLWELEKDRGLAVDGTTEEMLEQAEAAGIVGDQWRSAGERIIRALDALVSRLDLLIAEMFPGVGQAIEDSIGGAKDWLKDNPLIVPVKYAYPDGEVRHLSGPAGYAGGGLVTPFGPAYYADGGEVRHVPSDGTEAGGRVCPRERRLPTPVGELVAA